MTISQINRFLENAYTHANFAGMEAPLRRAPVYMLLMALPALAMVAPGCGLGAVKQPEGYPPPGTMSVVSVEPLNYGKNLFPSGNFIEWYAGSTVPSGAFVAPGPQSEIARGSGHYADGSFALEQTWKQPDSRWNETGRFGFHIALEKYSTYELTITAKSTSPTPISLDVSGVIGNGKTVPLAAGLLQIPQSSEWVEYRGTFTVGILPELFFSTVLKTMPPEGNIPKLSLDDICIVLVQAGKPPSPPQPSEDNLIANGSFEEWVNGTPLPEGLFCAPNVAFSAVFPYMETVGSGKISVHQVWSQNDASAPAENLFGVNVAVKPNTQYQFSSLVSAVTQTPLAIAVYGVKEGKELVVLKDPLVETSAETNFGPFQGSFDSGDFESIRIVTHVLGKDTKMPVRALWDAWKLAPSSGNAPQ